MVETNFLFRKVPKEVLKHCDYSYGSKLSKETKVTACHITNIINLFYKEKLITKEKIKSKLVVTIKLTSKGKEVLKLIEKIEELMEDG